MDPVSRPKRPLGLGAFVIVMVLALIVGGLAGAAQALLGDRPGVAGTALTAGLLSVAMAVAFAACVWWWRGIDEAAREAHKWAWWWGGSGGMTVGIVLLTLLTVDGDRLSPARVALSASDLIIVGMMTILLFQMAGYAVAWAVWWLRRR